MIFRVFKWEWENKKKVRESSIHNSAIIDGPTHSGAFNYNCNNTDCAYSYQTKRLIFPSFYLRLIDSINSNFLLGNVCCINSDLAFEGNH